MRVNGKCDTGTSTKAHIAFDGVVIGTGHGAQMHIRDFSRNFLNGWKIQPMTLKHTLNYLSLSQQVYSNMDVDCCYATHVYIA